jgi:hypothetical protein
MAEQYCYPKFAFTDEQSAADRAALAALAVGDELLVITSSISTDPGAYLVNVTRVMPTQFLTLPVSAKHGEQRWLRRTGHLQGYASFFPPGVHALTPEAREFWCLFQVEAKRCQLVERINRSAWELGPVQAEVLWRLQITLLHGDPALNYLETLLVLQNALGREVAQE